MQHSCCTGLVRATIVSLTVQAWLSLIVVTIVLGLLLLLLAGTVHYWQAWVYVALYAGASALIIAYALHHDRDVLRRRMRAGPMAEHSTTQRVAMSFASVGYLLLLAVPALDRRWGWSQVSLVTVLVGDMLTVVSLASMLVVLRVNPYGAATIQIAEGQTVVSTGPYAFVRHPMYSGASLMLIGTPLALGSWWGLLGLVVLGPALVWRMLDEERFLSENLPGYSAYMAQVRFRLIPNVV